MSLPDSIGRYEIRAELGRGGMATVYRAFDPRIRRDVAVKVLPREFLHDPQFQARFEREAQTIAALEHPAIVTVYDFGEQDGQPYFVMRLMTGGSLADRIEKAPLSLTEAARIFSRLAPALDWAHAHGIIHRDLKPGNILFDEGDDPYISDFGIAKLTQASASFTGSAIVGTPAYMSPEQARGEKDIDGRSDIYALGAIVFQMLTGKYPYEADTPMGVVVKHLTEPVPRILDAKPELPQACEQVIERAMAKNREERYATASAMAETLASVASSAPALPKPAPAESISLPVTQPLRETAATPVKRGWRGLWLVLGAAGLITVGGLAGMTWYVGRVNQARPTPTTTALPSATGQALAVVPQASSTFTPALPTVAPTVPPPTATPTVPSPTPTIAPTSTPRPTQTSTPQPAWVTDFAQPILAAIADRQPKFQDDFSTRTGGWTMVWPWCAKETYVGGEMVVADCYFSRQMWYTDFVAEMDARFTADSQQDGSQPLWRLYFRCAESSCHNGSSYKIVFHFDGNVEASVRPLGSDNTSSSIIDPPRLRASRPGQTTNHVLVIVKGQVIALFVNGQPVFRSEVEPLWLNGGMGWEVSGTAAFDNFKIWNISDLQ